MRLPCLVFGIILVRERHLNRRILIRVRLKKVFKPSLFLPSCDEFNKLVDGNVWHLAKNAYLYGKEII
jgi:hypothetical protein